MKLKDYLETRKIKLPSWFSLALNKQMAKTMDELFKAGELADEEFCSKTWFGGTYFFDEDKFIVEENKRFYEEDGYGYGKEVAESLFLIGMSEGSDYYAIKINSEEKTIFYIDNDYGRIESKFPDYLTYAQYQFNGTFEMLKDG